MLLLIYYNMLHLSVFAHLSDYLFQIYIMSFLCIVYMLFSPFRSKVISLDEDPCMGVFEDLCT